MDGSTRERLNVRTIRVSLEAALRHGHPGAEDGAVRSARRMLMRAREATSDPGVRREIDRTLAEIDGIGRLEAED